jgi:valyl-tRNA synthetase
MPGRYILGFLGIGISFSCINIVFLSLYDIFIIVRDSHVPPTPLTENIQKLEPEAKRIESKLGNDSLVAKAPEAVVNKEKEKPVEAKSALASFQSQADKIKLL